MRCKHILSAMLAVMLLAAAFGGSAEEMSTGSDSVKTKFADSIGAPIQRKAKQTSLKEAGG